MLPIHQFTLNHLEELNKKVYAIPPPADSETTEKKPRKRRTLDETNKRDFVCGCGKKYVSYPAIYLHVQRKHDGEWPENTVLPPKNENGEKIQKGRPKKDKKKPEEKEAPPPPENHNANFEDDFLNHLGQKGLQDKNKAENKFIKTFEAPEIECGKLLTNKELFRDSTFHKIIIDNLVYVQNLDVYCLNEALPMNDIFMSDRKILFFLKNLSRNLREEIYIELSIIVLFMRMIVWACIWEENNKSNILIKNGILYIKLEGNVYDIQINQFETLNIQALADANLCIFIGTLWGKIQAVTKGNALLLMRKSLMKQRRIEYLEMRFIQRFYEFGDQKFEKHLNRIAEGTLHLKQIELTDIARLTQNFFFLNNTNTSDLKIILQKICSWLPFFDVSLNDFPENNFVLEE